MKTIYLARHAKSSWDSGASKDFERPLSKRGEADALRMGEELNSLGWKPERIISSPAIRAKQTCEIYCQHTDYPIDTVVWNTEIYAAYMVTLLHQLTGLDESTNSIMLVGHNPSMEDLLIHLCGYKSVYEHQQKNSKVFTTANIVKITTDALWKDLVMNEAQLVKLLRPKEI